MIIKKQKPFKKTKKKKISPQEYEKYLQEFVGNTLTHFYYFMDRILVFRAGREYPDPDYDMIIKGKKESLDKSEFELWIHSDWQYEHAGKVIETSKPVPDESVVAFRMRMVRFAQSIHPRKVIAIRVSPDGKSAEVHLDIGSVFKVTSHEDRFINYWRDIFDSTGKLIASRAVYPKMHTGVLMHYENLFDYTHMVTTIKHIEERPISPQEYEKYLQEFAGRDLANFYIIEGGLTFTAGRQLRCHNTSFFGQKIRICNSELELNFECDWQYEHAGKVIETSKPVPDESVVAFRMRMVRFAQSIHPRKVIAIRVSPDGKSAEVHLDTGGTFVVIPQESMFINYTNCIFDTRGKVITRRLVKPLYKTGVLTYFEKSQIDTP